MERLDAISHEEPGSRAECLPVCDFVRLTCKMFRHGLEPVRLVRDGYVEALNAASLKKAPKGKPGRTKDPEIARRHEQIYKRFHEMSGKKSERKRQLAKEYSLRPNTIGRIVTRLDREKRGIK